LSLYSVFVSIGVFLVVL